MSAVSRFMYWWNRMDSSEKSGLICAMAGANVGAYVGTMDSREDQRERICGGVLGAVFGGFVGGGVGYLAPFMPFALPGIALGYYLK